MSRMEEILQEAKLVKPIAETNGSKIVDYEDAATLNAEEIIKQKLGENVNLGDVEVNQDGSLAKVYVPVIAMNEDRRLMNRYRLIGKKGGGGKLLQVVTDYRAVKEHGSGKVYLARIPAYELERVDGKLVLVRQITVSADDFISKFEEQLNNEAMHEVLQAVAVKTEDVTRNEMPI